MASRRYWMALLWNRKSSWAATFSSMSPISMLPSRGRPGAPPLATVSSRCAPSGACPRDRRRGVIAMTFHDGDEQARSTADAVARRSYGKLVAFLAARTRDVVAAEDALSEAFASALADWPRNGCPSNPEAWLLTVARRKAIDMARRQAHRRDAAPHLLLMAEELDAAASDSEIPDQRLALMFACAH